MITEEKVDLLQQEILKRIGNEFNNISADEDLCGDISLSTICKNPNILFSGWSLGTIYVFSNTEKPIHLKATTCNENHVKHKDKQFITVAGIINYLKKCYENNK